MHECGETFPAVVRIEEIDADRSHGLVVQAYARLAFLERRDDGASFATLARFGSYEVRLFEIWPEQALPDFPFLWIELYSHDARAAVDSSGNADFGAAGAAGEVFIREAWKRHKRATSDDPDERLTPPTR